jgi:hypothetical protein
VGYAEITQAQEAADLDQGDSTAAGTAAGAAERARRLRRRGHLALHLATEVQEVRFDRLTRKGWWAVQNFPVYVVRITAIFNPLNPDPDQKLALLSDDFQIDTILNKHSLSIAQGINMIVFDLMTLPGGTTDPAEFAPDPITWLDPTTGEPVPKPETFIVQKFIPNHLNLIDFNTVKVQNQHPLNINVLYDGVGYSSDPVIVNEPPMQPN